MRRKGLAPGEALHDPAVEKVNPAVAGLVIKHAALARHTHGALAVQMHVGPGRAQGEEPAHRAALQQLPLDPARVFAHAAQKGREKAAEVCLNCSASRLRSG